MKKGKKVAKQEVQPFQSGAVAEQSSAPQVDTVTEKDGMEDSEMEELLLTFSDSRAWLAYQKYINYRITYAEQALFSVDMFKNPTDAARNQGVRMGLMDLGIYVAELRRLRENKTEAHSTENNV